MNYKLALIAAALVASSSAMAADKRTSISVFGNISGASGQDPSGFLSTSLGYLITDHLEVGGQISENLTGGANGSSTTSAGVNFKFYFRSMGKGASVNPFIGASALSSSTSTGGSSSSIVQVGGGLEFAMSESAATFLELASSRTKTGNFTSNGYQMNLGVKLRF